MLKKKIIIGLPCTPSKYVSHKVVDCTRVLISYGGGMGGANKTYYAENIELKDGMLVLSLVKGSVVEVNPTFLVEKEKCKVAIIEYDVSPWANKDNAIEINYISLEMNEELVIDKNSYTPRHTGILERKVIFNDKNH
jgi:hypothetical protein